MADYKIQLKDEHGNRQYPVSTTEVVVDADGVSVAELLNRKQDRLVSGQNIKTINGKSILGSGNLDIEGGSGGGTSDDVESYPIYYSREGNPLTDEQKAANKEAYDAVVAAWDADEQQMPYLYPYNLGKLFPFLVLDYNVDEGRVGILLNIDLMPAPLSDYGIPLLATGLISVSEGLNLYSDGSITIEYSKNYVSPDISAMQELAKGSGGSGEAAESDVISVVWDDDTSDIPSNKEAYQKLAESINTVGKPLSVMVTVETGFRWGIAKYYWKSNVGGDIELTTPVTESGLYCVFTLTSEGVCTASYKQADLGGGGESTLESSLGVYVSDSLTEEQIEHNKNAYETYYNAADKPTVYIIGSSSQPICVWQSSDSGVEFLVIDALVYFGSSEESILYVHTMARWNADGTITEMQGGLRTVPTAEGIKTINGQSLIGKGDLTIEGGGLKYFVERYVYEGNTEEERTYNLESLAMLDEGIDILWAGFGGGLQPNYEGAMWHVSSETGQFAYNATAEINAETGVLEIHAATFLRDFYLGNAYKEYVKAFFAEENSIYKRAFYLGQPIISWFEETDTTVRAYYIGNGLVYSYVLINIETGEVSEPVIVQ